MGKEDKSNIQSLEGLSTSELSKIAFDSPNRNDPYKERARDLYIFKFAQERMSDERRQQIIGLTIHADSDSLLEIFDDLEPSKSILKYVRQGGTLIIFPRTEETDFKHFDHAVANNLHDPDDAGYITFSLIDDKKIHIYGFSQSLGIRSNNPERENTVSLLNKLAPEITVKSGY